MEMIYSLRPPWKCFSDFLFLGLCECYSSNLQPWGKWLRAHKVGATGAPKFFPVSPLPKLSFISVIATWSSESPSAILSHQPVLLNFASFSLFLSFILNSSVSVSVAFPLFPLWLTLCLYRSHRQTLAFHSLFPDPLCPHTYHCLSYFPTKKLFLTLYICIWYSNPV